MRSNGNGWETVSVTIDVVITDDRAPLGKQDKTKTFRPFEESQARGLSRRDIYQFLMYALLIGNRFEQQSGEHITRIGGVITKLKKMKIEDICMGDTVLSALVDKCNNYRKITQNKGSCVQNYIYEACKGENRFKRYTKLSLTEEINRYVFDKHAKRPFTREILDWRDNCHTNVSIYALVPFYNKFVSSPAPRNNGKTFCLCFICKDGHCFPILNEDLVTKITKGSPLLNRLDLIQWNFKQNEDKIVICKTKEDYYNIINHSKKCAIFANADKTKDYENYLIVLPDGHTGKDMMVETMQRAQTYIEYFHYDRRNQIDGFITPDLKNMVSVNNDYELRKNICDKLFEKYPVDAFKFNNQGLTSIAVNLFKQLYGHLKSSNYNKHTISIIDDYYPKALQHTFHKEFNKDDPKNDEEEELTALDIAKDYPSVLLTNEHDIPLYNIHNKITKFDGKLKTGEYYINETLIKKYRTLNNDPIIIKAGFYGRNLIDYLLKNKFITLQDIKLQLVTDKSIKHDSFKGYIKYVFDNFDEANAKKLANQFIGYLGTKYDKSSKGFTSTSYDTACAVWTEALENNEKVSIHKEDDFFLIRKIDIKRRMTENCSINRHVISGSIMKLLEVIEEACDKHTIIHGYNTDAVYCENPYKEYPIKDKQQNFTSDMIGKVYQKIGETPSMIDKSYRKNIDLNDYEIEPGKGTLITGGAGCGKTTKLINDAKESKNPIIFSFTNKAVDNIRSRIDNSLKDKVHTFDSYFNEFT